jgi:hypothetical protein
MEEIYSSHAPLIVTAIFFAGVFVFCVDMMIDAAHDIAAKAYSIKQKEKEMIDTPRAVRIETEQKKESKTSMEEANELLLNITNWQTKNFPNATMEEPLLGMIEEIGEIIESNSFADQMDGVADFMIFTIHYCHILSLFNDEFFQYKFKKALISPCRATKEQKNLINVYLPCSKLCHETLKEKQGIRPDTERINKIKEEILTAMENLNVFFNHTVVPSMSLYKAVQSVFSKVISERDWIRYPMNGETE